MDVRVSASFHRSGGNYGLIITRAALKRGDNASQPQPGLPVQRTEAHSSQPLISNLCL